MANFVVEPNMVFNSTCDIEPRVLRAPFGDGYSQRTPDGINTTPERWILKWSVLEPLYSSLTAQLEAAKGVTPIQWHPPGESTDRNFTVVKWSKTPLEDTGGEVSAEAIEEFDLI
jgi:phage-related protein